MTLRAFRSPLGILSFFLGGSGLGFSYESGFLLAKESFFVLRYLLVEIEALFKSSFCYFFYWGLSQILVTLECFRSFGIFGFGAF